MDFISNFCSIVHTLDGHGTFSYNISFLVLFSSLPNDIDSDIHLIKLHVQNGAAVHEDVEGHSLILGL